MANHGSQQLWHGCCMCDSGLATFSSRALCCKCCLVPLIGRPERLIAGAERLSTNKFRLNGCPSLGPAAILRRHLAHLRSGVLQVCPAVSRRQWPRRHLEPRLQVQWPRRHLAPRLQVTGAVPRPMFHGHAMCAIRCHGAAGVCGGRCRSRMMRRRTISGRRMMMRRMTMPGCAKQLVSGRRLKTFMGKPCDRRPVRFPLSPTSPLPCGHARSAGT